MRLRAERGLYLMLTLCQRFPGWRRAAGYFSGEGARQCIIIPLYLPQRGRDQLAVRRLCGVASHTLPSAPRRPRAEHGLNFMLLLYQRFAGWRRVVKYFSQRSTAAALKR